ncbi:hypothetical protein D049_2669B, partial [Vibrio parahaemolyticus VPTS-2010]
AVLR